MVVSEGWKNREMGSFCFMGNEFQLGKIKKMKTFMYLLHNNVNVLNASVVYI